MSLILEKLTRLNTLFERTADQKSGGIRQDKLARILPKGLITSIKYDTQLKFDKKDKKELRIISRGPFLAMFAQESVSFLNSLAVNERLERERRQRRHKAPNQSIESPSSFDAARERSQSAPSGMVRDICDLSSDSKTSKKVSTKSKRRKEQKNEFKQTKEKTKKSPSSSSKRKSKGSHEKKSLEDNKEKKKISKDKGHRRKRSTSSGSTSSNSGKRVDINKEKALWKSNEISKTLREETSENDASFGSTLAISDSSIEPPSGIKVTFHSSFLLEETKSSDFSDSFGEIMISNEPYCTHLSYSYSISDDEVENTNYKANQYVDNNVNVGVEDEKLCSFLSSLSFFIQGLVSKKGNFVTRESPDFNELARKDRQTYPCVQKSNSPFPQTIMTRPKSKRGKASNNVGGSNVLNSKNNDCPFRQSPIETSRKSFNGYTPDRKFVR